MRRSLTLAEMRFLLGGPNLRARGDESNQGSHSKIVVIFCSDPSLMWRLQGYIRKSMYLSKNSLLAPRKAKTLNGLLLVTAGLPKLRDEKEAVGGMRVI